MSNKVQEFLNEQFGEVRCFKEGDIIWFLAKDIADSLEYSETNAMTKKIDEEDIKKIASDKLEGANNMAREFTIINEGGLYQAVLGITKKNPSRYEKSRKFKRWITNEVIPTIRNTGGYVEEEREEEFIYKYFTGLTEETKQAMVVDLIKNNKKLQVKADCFDKFLDTSSTYTFTEVSKLISTISKENEESEIKISSTKLTELLRNEGVLCKTKTLDKKKEDGTIKKGSYKNLPNKDYENYFDVVSVEAGKFNKVQTRVKPEGVKFIYSKLKENLNY